VLVDSVMYYFDNSVDTIDLDGPNETHAKFIAPSLKISMQYLISANKDVFASSKRFVI